MSARKPSELVDAVDRIVGARLAEVRRRRGVSAAALAERSELSVQEIEAIESGCAKIYASTLFVLSTLLDTPLRELLPPQLH